MNSVLNIPEIQNYIKINHGKFIKKYGTQIEKVMADHRMLIDIISARLHRVILCFKEEGVIDEVRTSDKGPLKMMSLFKNGCSVYVDLMTNGKLVVLKSLNFNEFIGSDIASDPEYFYGVDEENYDWEKFSIRLLDYLHCKIYERKDVLDEKVREMFAVSEDKKSSRKTKKE